MPQGNLRHDPSIPWPFHREASGILSTLTSFASAIPQWFTCHMKTFLIYIYMKWLAIKDDQCLKDLDIRLLQDKSTTTLLALWRVYNTSIKQLEGS